METALLLLLIIALFPAIAKMAAELLQRIDKRPRRSAHDHAR